MRRMRQGFPCPYVSHALMLPRCLHRVLTRRLSPLSNRTCASLVHFLPPPSGSPSTLQRRLILRTFFLSKNRLQMLALTSLMLVLEIQELSHASSARRKVVSASIVGSLCSRTVTLSFHLREPLGMEMQPDRVLAPMRVCLSRRHKPAWPSAAFLPLQPMAIRRNNRSLLHAELLVGVDLSSAFSVAVKIVSALTADTH